MSLSLPPDSQDFTPSAFRDRTKSVLTPAQTGAQQSGEVAAGASDFDLNPLLGEWHGEYNGSETGRSGTIAFTLRAGEANASGNVVMIPQSAGS